MIVDSRNNALLREKQLLKRLFTREERELILLLEHERTPFLNSCLEVSRSVMPEYAGLF